MENTRIFEKLVSNLSSQERDELISRLTRSDDISSVVVSLPEEDAVEVQWEKKFESMSWLEKFVIFLRGLFGGKTREELVSQKIFDDLSHQIDGQIPGMINFRIGLFHSGFYDELKALFDAFSVFRKPLAKAFGANKGDFFAFLVGLEIPEVQQNLLDTTDPWKLYEENRERASKDIKMILDGNLRTSLDGISVEKRKTLFQSVKTLFALKNLAMMQEEKLLAPFLLLSQNEGASNAGFDEVKGALMELWEKLSALPITPPARVLEGLFLFSLQESISNEREGLGESLQELIEQSRHAIQTLKLFHARIPLGKIVAYLYNNLSIRPEPLGGVDDWFTVYKKFWQDKISSEFRDFSRERSRRLLMHDIQEFLGVDAELWGKTTFYPPFYRSKVPLFGENVLILSHFFLHNVFMPKMNALLKILLLEGQFYKKVNRESFIEGYNHILLIPERLSFFVKNFQQEGDWGKLLGDLPQLKTEPQKIERVKDVFLMAGDWVAVFVKNTVDSGQIFYDVLHGLVHGKTGNAYDTLVNLGQIGGKNNPSFRKELQNTLHRWERYLRLIKELMSLEDNAT